MTFVRTLYSPVLNNRRGVLINGGGGGQTGDLNINKRGGRSEKCSRSKKCSTITLNKIRKANQSNFTIRQSRNIQIYVFETSLIQL